MAKLKEYNNKTLPYFEKYLTPNNVTLLHASSGYRNDTFANQLIDKVDTRNKSLFQALENKKVLANFIQKNLAEIVLLDELDALTHKV